MIKKLIEVAIPLEKINAESAREKSIRHGHPSTLHLWWARRPLAAARAIIWASLVDDPSSHPELFPTENDQARERQRLFHILEDLVVWENSNNRDVLDEANREIIRCTKGNPPALLDPFAGGGAIPLEGKRLGLNVYAHDLNPVAVLINKAMLEIPSIFCDFQPVNPEKQGTLPVYWSGIKGIISDIQYYSALLKKNTWEVIGNNYPLCDIPKDYGGGQTKVIAWIWARTVRCPNPACSCRMPLIRSRTLSKKKGRISWIKVQSSKNGNIYSIEHNGTPKMEGSVGRKGATCIHCGTPVSLEYIREEGRSERMLSELCGIVAESKKGRIYLSPDPLQQQAANVQRPTDYPDATLPNNPRDFKTPNYGMDSYSKLFTNRQLLLLTTLCKQITEIQKIIEEDAKKTGYKDDHLSLEEGGNGALAYSQAVTVYLSFIVDKLADYHSTICSWHSSKELIRNTFGRQAIPMTWDYAEANPFSGSAGCFDNMVEWVIKSLEVMPVNDKSAVVTQNNAQSDCGLRNVMVSTDPPYYDNIGYADLSDFFYIWLRNNLSSVYPKLFKTIMVPKEEELVATPYRFEGGERSAKLFFEEGMLAACKHIYAYSLNEIPVSIYYAYKQSEIDESKTSSTGWETMLSAIINAGFTITGTWPIRTEMANRNIATDANALASSIVLVCRKRSEDAPQTTRRNLTNTLRRELRPALKQLQGSNIAPVDLAQSAIGPGMGVFSRYRKVLEADGTPMSVRSALQVINEEIDRYFNEQVSDLDIMSRFCVDLYTQNAFNDIKFGDADILARAKGTSVATLSSHGVVYAKAGTVHLIERTELPEKIDNNETCIWMLTQQLTQAMATGGVEACAKAIIMMLGSNAERAKDLAYRLYTIAEQKKWSTEAFAYNALVVAWPDIQSRAAMMKRETPEQLDLFSMGLLDPNS